MARCLIIGCGCRGVTLARSLVAEGHAVRGTTRDPGRAHALTDAGIEPYVGDPDRVATLNPALEHVSLACILLGSAVGAPDEVEALHGTRLEMLLSRILDTTVRGVLYEAAGSVERAVLAGGAARVRRTCEDSRIPYVLLEHAPVDHAGWLDAAKAGVGQLLGRG